MKDSTQPQGNVNRALFAQAVRDVCRAISDFGGADCTLYAIIGAQALCELGLPARAAAGSAAWRVGPGDPDVLSHAPEITGQLFVPEGASRAGMFHAWVEVDAVDGAEAAVADFTTWQLPAKARALDQADGGTTRVDFKPEYLWIPRRQATRLSAHDVLQSFDTGVYMYRRHESIEQLVLSDEARAKALPYVMPTMLAYRALCRGDRITMVGVGGVSTDLPAQRSYKPLGP